MAKSGLRNAGIEIKIEGERELNAQINRITKQYEMLSLEVERVKKAYDGERNTAAALNSQLMATQEVIKSLKDQWSAYAQKSEAVSKAIEEQKEKHYQNYLALDKAEKELKAAESTLDNNSEKYKELKKAVETARVEYDKSGATLNDLEKKLYNNEKAMIKNRIATYDWENEEKKLKGYLAETGESADRTAKSIDKYGHVITDTEKNIQSMADNLDFQVAWDVAKEVVGAVSDLYDKLADKIQECVQAYYDFETATISVSKTVSELNEEQAAEMINNLSRSVPLTREEIASVLSQGGQYGISKQGLESFANAMMALASATNIGTEDLASVAQLASLLRTSEDEYERLGSTLTDLGNKTRTTEKDTVHMAQTIAASANIVGLSQAETLGLANALAATGGQARGAGTAMTRFISNLDEAVQNGGEKLEEYAAIAGMTAYEFKTTFKNDAMEGILAVLGGMNDVIENGGSIYEVFQRLGVKNIMEKQNLKNLAVAYDDVVKSVRIAEGAWDDNTALMDEFGKAVNTNNSQITLFENKMEGLRIEFGKWFTEENNIDQLRVAFGYLADDLKEMYKTANDIDNSDDMTIAPWTRYETARDKWANKVVMEHRLPGLADGAARGAIKRASYDSGSDSADYFLRGWTETYGTGAEDPIVQQLGKLEGRFWEYKHEIDAVAEELSESYSKTFDPLKKFSEKGQLSMNQIVDNYKNNADKMAKYADNLAKVLADPTIPDSMKEWIKAQDPSDIYKALDDLVKASPKKLAQWVQSWEESAGSMDESLDDIALSVSGFPDDVIEALRSGNLPSKLYDELYGAGKNGVLGLENGLNDPAAIIALKKAARRLADTVSNIYTNRQEISSPSKKMKRYGQSDVQGLIEGWKSKEQDLQTEVEKMADLTAMSYVSSLAKMSGDINTAISVNTRDYTSILKRMDNKLGRNNTVVIEKPGRSSQSTVNDLERALVRGMLY